MFERKVWRVQTAHLHNAAHALSSRSRCSVVKTNIYFMNFDIVLKKQIECGSLIDNDTRHHSGQNVMTHEVQPSESATNWATSQSARFALVSKSAAYTHGQIADAELANQSALCFSYVIKIDNSKWTEGFFVIIDFWFWYRRFHLSVDTWQRTCSNRRP